MRVMRGFDPILEPVSARAMTLAEPLTRNRLGAAALRAGIRYEALLRDQQQRYFSAVTFGTGHRTKQQRWAEEEAGERQRLAPGRPVRGAGVPVVFWHGPDSVESSGRPVVVLVNGWTASGLMWPADLLARLGETFDVIRIDNRGSGYSRTAPAPFTIAQLADDVADVMRAVGAGSATIVGFSMGGVIAQELAFRHPRLVERLVLCGTRPSAPAGILPPQSVLDTMMSSPRRGEPLHEYVDRVWRTVVGPGFAEASPQAMRELVDLVCARSTPRAGTLAQMRAVSSWHRADSMHRLSVPTTVIHGRDDPLTPVGNGMRLSQLISGSTYVELAGVGHLIPFEAPEAVVSAVRA